MERLTPRGPPGHLPQGEASACWWLTVRVLEARGLGWADVLSEADPYVVLQLPTAPGIKFKTKTITNSSHPVWNETFSFLIQTQVKNVLELSVYDEDSVTEDDLCFKFLYDISEVLPGKLLQKTFSLRPQGQGELDVEFLMEKTSECPENLITNNVLVARELSCLDVRVESVKSTVVVSSETCSEPDQDNLELELVLKGSYEDTQTSALGTASAFRFHYLAAQEAELSGRLKSSKSNGWNSDSSAGHLTVPLRPVTVGKELVVDVPATNVPRVRLQLKAESCPKDLAVRLGFDLCAEEKAFLSRRKQVVAKALKEALQLDRDLQEDEVPIVGIMATGGGARAMTSLYGHLLALKKLGLLDCVTYFSGISGATWTMAQLYGDPEWSQTDLQGHIRHAREHLAKSQWEAISAERLTTYRRELELRAERGQPTSFVDLWALVLESKLHSQVVDQKLSGQRAALERGQNPLPLYLSLNVKDNNLETFDFKEWVEFSPYEVGFLKYGAFVPSELFGSEFFMGQLMKRLPESRICFLEGIWSNLYAANLQDSLYWASEPSQFWDRWARDQAGLDKEQVPLLKTEEPPTVTGRIAEFFTNLLTWRPLTQATHNFLRGLHFHRDYFQHPHFSTWKATKLDGLPNKLTPAEPHLCLLDVGYLINTSCPPLLQPTRDVDLILSLDYNLHGAFQQLQLLGRFCREQGIPFPPVSPSPEEQCQPRECHLFLDPDCPEAPAVLHFPLVCDSFREHSAPGIPRTAEEKAAGEVNLSSSDSPYHYSKVTYSPEDMDKLLRLTHYNICNNREQLLAALREAVWRRRQRKPQ